MYRLGIDVGGSFTDFVLAEIASPNVHFFKIPSTPADPSVAIANGVREMLALFAVSPSDVSFLGHGTTVATNMIIERRGAVTGLLSTRGFRDVLAIGRQTRPNLFDYSESRAPALVDRERRLEIDERLDADGEVLKPLNSADVEAAALKFKEMKVEAVAISFLHSYRDSAHEERARQVIESLLPGVYVSISSEVLPEFREFERTSTTTLNAYVGPRMQAYIEKLRSRIAETGIEQEPLVVHSNGGLLSLASVEERPVLTCLSGPAAGVNGAAALGVQSGLRDIITFDVGGTSTDVSLISDGQPKFATDRSVAGYPVKLPMIDIHVIGAGGGSIASVDDAGGLKVGPRSAGAKPGPVAYDLGGTEPTLTDANICLKRLNPVALLDGRMPINREKAWAAIESQIAKPLGLSVEDAALGMLRVATANMSRAIRAVSNEHGSDLKAFTLMAFGGAGPLHAADVAREAGILKICVPREPGTMCARGILLSDMTRDLVTTQLLTVDADNWSQITSCLERMVSQGNEWLDEERVEPAQRSFVASVDARYLGQNHHIQVILDSASSDGYTKFCEAFHAAHKKQYGYDIRDRALQIVNCRLKAVGAIVRSDAEVKSVGGAFEHALIDEREVYFEEGWLPTRVYRRTALPQGASMTGPAIVEEMSSTTIVLPGQQFVIDAQGNLIVQ